MGPWTHLVARHGEDVTEASATDVVCDLSTHQEGMQEGCSTHRGHVWAASTRQSTGIPAHAQHPAGCHNTPHSDNCTQTQQPPFKPRDEGGKTSHVRTKNKSAPPPPFKPAREWKEEKTRDGAVEGVFTRRKLRKTRDGGGGVRRKGWREGRGGIE